MASDTQRPSSEAASFLRLAFSPDVVRRALAYAVVVGACLIAINHGEAIVSGSIDGKRWLQMVLTVCVPYCVSTLSSVAALRGRDRRKGGDP